MNKRGQFFLVAALAIVGVLVGLASVYTAAETLPEDNTVYDLSKEINFEAVSIIDHGTFYALSASEESAHLNILTDAYARSNPETDFVVIYGNSTNLTITSYASEDTGSIGLSFGGQNSQFSVGNQREKTDSINPQGEKTVTILIDPNDKDIKHTFNLKAGETFFVIAKEEKQGERYVATAI